MIQKTLKYQYIVNTGILGVARILENIIGYIIIVLLTRSFGAEGLGIYSFVFSFVGFFFIFSDLGLSTLMQKDVSKNYKLLAKYANTITSIKVMSTSICFLTLTLLTFFFRYDLLLEIIIVGCIYVANNLNAAAYTSILLKKKGGTLSSLMLLDRFISVIGIALMITFFQNLRGLLLILLVATIIRVIINNIISSKYYKPKLTFEWKYKWKLLKRSYPFLLIGFFSTIYIQVDTIFLSYLHSNTIVGFYNAPYRLINMLFFIPGLMMTFGFPLLSELERTDKQAMKKLFKHIVFYSMSFLFPIVIGIWIYAPRILEFIYGFSDIESVITFYILSIAMVFIFITTYLGHLLSAHNMQKKFLVISLIGASINVILNSILIPTYSLYGAGVANILTYILMFLLLHYLVQKNIWGNYLDLKLLISLVGCLVMVLVSPVVIEYHLAIGIIILGGLYALIVWPICVWIDFKNEIKRFKRKIKTHFTYQ